MHLQSTLYKTYINIYSSFAFNSFSTWYALQCSKHIYMLCIN